METLVLEMFDKVMCTTNVKQNKGFDKNKRLKRHAWKSSPITLNMQQDVKQAEVAQADTDKWQGF